MTHLNDAFMEELPMFLFFAFVVAIFGGSTGWIALWIALHWLSHNCSNECTRKHT